MPDWLDPPYQFVRLAPGASATLEVYAIEVGQAFRPLTRPPWVVPAPAVRLWIVGPAGWGLRPYADFSGQRLQELLSDLLDHLPGRPVRVTLSPTYAGVETRYTVAVAPP